MDDRGIHRLIRDLGSSNWDVRHDAVKKLVKIGEPAVPALIDTMKDDSPYMRHNAALVLDRIGDVRAVLPLIDALKDEEEGVRDRAVDALVSIGDERAVLPLMDVLKDDNQRMRKATAEGLGQIGDSSAVPALIDALKDENKEVRYAAAEALGKFSDKGIDCSAAVPALIDALKGNSIDFSKPGEVLGKIGVNEEQLEMIIGVLSGGKTWAEIWVIMHGADALGEIGDVRAVPALIDALKHEDYHVRRKAAEALEEIARKGGDISPAVPALIDALKDKEPSVGYYAAFALAEIGDSRSVYYLISALKSEGDSLRSMNDRAFYALGQIAEKGVDVTCAVPALIINSNVHPKYFARVFAKIGKPAVPYLIVALKNEDKQSGAARALGKIAEKGVDVTSAVPALIDTFKDKNSDVREAAEALGIIGEPAVPYLISTLKHEDVRVWKNAAEALGNISEKATDKGDYASALKIIKDSTTVIMEFHSGKKDKYTPKKRRERLAKFGSLAQQIHDKMNSVDNDKKFPVKHQPVRAVRKKVVHNG